MVRSGWVAVAFFCTSAFIFYFYHCFGAHLIADTGVGVQSSSADYMAKMADGVLISIPWDRVLVGKRYIHNPSIRLSVWGDSPLSIGASSFHVDYPPSDCGNCLIFGLMSICQPLALENFLRMEVSSQMCERKSMKKILDKDLLTYTRNSENIKGGKKRFSPPLCPPKCEEPEIDACSQKKARYRIFNSATGPFIYLFESY